MTAAAKTRRSDPVAGACTDLAIYLHRVHQLIPEQVSQDSAGQFSTVKVSFTPEPWFVPAGRVFMVIHEGVRRLEAALRYAVTGHPGKRRGGSDGNTAEALTAIPKLAAGLSNDARDGAEWILTQWINVAKAVDGIDEAPRWRPLPMFRCDRHRVRGCVDCCKHLPPRCPYCRTYQLHALVEAKVVSCHMPGCVDGNGFPPVAQIGTDDHGRPQLTWADGRIEAAPDMEGD